MILRFLQLGAHFLATSTAKLVLTVKLAGALRKALRGTVSRIMSQVAILRCLKKPLAASDCVELDIPIRSFVSILIPCHNAERWVAQAVESALAQTWLQKEVLVVDDGSQDGSLDAIKKFGDRIRWETGPNRGGNHTRNRLLELARGEWLQYLDADDYLLPDKIERQVEFLAAHPATDIVFGPMTMEYAEKKDSPRKLLPIP